MNKFWKENGLCLVGIVFMVVGCLTQLLVDASHDGMYYSGLAIYLVWLWNKIK